VRIEGVIAGSNAGFRVSSAGDVDGDGLDDVLVGAPNADLPGGREAAGQTFLVSGAAIVASSEGSGVFRLRERHADPATVGATNPSPARGKG